MNNKSLQQNQQIDIEKIIKQKQESIRKSQYFKKENVEKTQQFGIIHDYLLLLLEKGLIKWEERNKAFNEIAKWVLNKWVWFESDYLSNYFNKKAETKRAKENGIEH